MRRRFTYVVLAALVLLAAGASSTLAAGGEQTYVFNGRLLADAGSSSSLYVDIDGGNKPALKKLVGQSDNQNFAVGGGTQYLRWAHGVPTVVAESNLVAGMRVDQPGGWSRAFTHSSCSGRSGGMIRSSP